MNTVKFYSAVTVLILIIAIIERISLNNIVFMITIILLLIGILGFIIDSITPPQEYWLSPDKYERVYARKILPRKSISQLQVEGWQPIKNLGNIKLVKFLK